jgi:hypothetical protein
MSIDAEGKAFPRDRGVVGDRGIEDAHGAVDGPKLVGSERMPRVDTVRRRRELIRLDPVEGADHLLARVAGVAHVVHRLEFALPFCAPEGELLVFDDQRRRSDDERASEVIRCVERRGRVGRRRVRSGEQGEDEGQGGADRPGDRCASQSLAPTQVEASHGRSQPPPAGRFVVTAP